MARNGSEVKQIATVLFVLIFSSATFAQTPQKDIPAIAKAANGAVVTIIMAVNDKPIAQGTGFLVSSDGVVVTNYHVIANGNRAIVKFPDEMILPVDGVLAADKIRDLAVIKIHGKSFRTLTLGNSDRIQVGEEVVAIGNPLSLESTVSNGIVSGIRTAEEKGGKFLQTTAPISPGSSGGPLFNMQGEVVGINTMYLEGGENLNFAIPVNDAKRLLLNQSGKLQKLPNEPDSEEAPKDTHNAQDSPSQQKECNEQAAYLAQYRLSEYVNRYDAGSGKCYVEFIRDISRYLISIIPQTFPGWASYSSETRGYSVSLLGESEYGLFWVHRDGVRKPDGECTIWPGGHTNNALDRVIKCQSEEEFNDLAAKYFGIVQAPRPTN